jgi:hypothetical protein
MKKQTKGTWQNFEDSPKPSALSINGDEKFTGGNKEYYTPRKVYIHKSLFYTCKFIGYQRNKPTYEVLSTNEKSGFKIGDQFTPNEPEKWFDISNVFVN